MAYREMTQEEQDKTHGFMVKVIDMADEMEIFKTEFTSALASLIITKIGNEADNPFEGLISYGHLFLDMAMKYKNESRSKETQE
ncbi:hypothetical protein SBF1_6970003 [Candidatus Desulfosporosinus infrequens]|uniref:Uncharacterized protein n=1 Tax=Candidatus Desulfosporosinus infrequens TaxID=2043169 RepID=A0A2U3LP85_9FIRM|nr:hypothetical protein SBF1_6970003 [Candidatus Desulfosporosinus infrequens]